MKLEYTLLLLLMVIIPTASLTATAVSYDTVSIRLDNPQFCTYNDDVRLQTLTFLALHQWEKELTLEHPVNWNTDLISVDSIDWNRCNVVIQFVDNVENPLDLGKTDLNSQDALITIPLYFEGKRLPTQDLLNSLTHEVGHSMGLGHYDSGIPNDKDSIMSPQFEPFKSIILEIGMIDIMKMIETYPEGFQ